MQSALVVFTHLVMSDFADIHAAELYDPWVDDEDAAPNEYREASMVFLNQLTTALTWITENRQPAVAAWAACYCYGLPVCEGVSMSDRAEQLGISVGAFSKAVRTIQRRAGVSESAYCFKKD